MAIVDRHIDPGGLSPAVLNVLDKWVVSAKASAAAGVKTYASAFSAATLNSTVAPGTQIDYARNLLYQISVVGGTDSTAIISGGTCVVIGTDIRGSSISESVALTQMVSGTVPVEGSAMFASVATISWSNVSLHTGSSSNSSCVSASVGVGNIIGLPQSVKYTNAVPMAWIGTARQDGSFTVKTGDFISAGVSFSNAVATNTPVQINFFRNS